MSTVAAPSSHGRRDPALEATVDEPGGDELAVAVEKFAFMGFWISHVPWGRCAEFWALVDRSLRPGGRVLFGDDAHRTEHELIHGEASTTIQRRLRDGTPHREVTVPHTPEGLEQELTRLGWSIRVHRTGGPFYRGIGTRAAERRQPWWRRACRKPRRSGPAPRGDRPRLSRSAPA
ncbi:hypothetical protein GCM10009613_13770 [Pseudonocardia kongjuensis]|uniref:Methyltransferase type 11 domain-containing protein n=1 Tax=Pseudonocardia kongjuensis TaxID=102227 RepID=A0ABN1XN51_9PSEU